MGNDFRLHSLFGEYPDDDDRAAYAEMAYDRLVGGWEIAEIAAAWGKTELTVHELIAYHLRFGHGR